MIFYFADSRKLIFERKFKTFFDSYYFVAKKLDNKKSDFLAVLRFLVVTLFLTICIF